MDENLRSLLHWMVHSPFLVPFRGSIPAATLFPPEFDGGPESCPARAAIFAETYQKLRQNQTRPWRIGLDFEDVASSPFSFASGGHGSSTWHSLLSERRDQISLLRFRGREDFRLHIEAAVKFYLCLDRRGSADAHRFVGTKQRDTLGRKLEKMETEQLRRFVDQPLTRALIPIESDTVIESTPLVKGVLFYPGEVDRPFSEFLEELKSFAAPEVVSAEHARGFWIREDERDAWVESLRGTPYSGIVSFGSKSAWIREVDGRNALADALRTREEFRSREISTPASFAVVAPSGKTTSPPVRFFVVPNQWKDSPE